MTPAWNDYIQAPGGHEAFRERHRETYVSYEAQRRVLHRVVESLRPTNVACLGAGTLTDIPVTELIEMGATLHLVDWVPGVIDAGLSAQISRLSEDGLPECLFCKLDRALAEDYCKRFGCSGEFPASVCDNFSPVAGDPARCEAYERNREPSVLEQDVTCGYASAFGRNLTSLISESQSWRQGLKMAAAVAKNVETQRLPLELGDNTMDLVISSLVISQFEHEPYTYFSREMASRLGAPSSSEEKRLQPSVERLRATLLKNQILRHCEEIDRILKPDGHCVISFELFHQSEDDQRWFLVREMHQALAIIAQRFRFDFNVLPPGDHAVRFETQKGASMVYLFVLTPNG